MGTSTQDSWFRSKSFGKFEELRIVCRKKNIMSSMNKENEVERTTISVSGPDDYSRQETILGYLGTQKSACMSPRSSARCTTISISAPEDYSSHMEDAVLG